MFTGIIERIGEVRAFERRGEGARLTIAAAGFWDELKTGASVAVDGVCLTLVVTRGEGAEFDIVAETLRRTTLSDLRPGSRVNLERSIPANGRLDGHFVQGHVDAVGAVARVEDASGEVRRGFRLDRAWMKYVVPKGSIAVDGISLTVASVEAEGFEVALVPTTLGQTTLGSKPLGRRVNIETDILARTVVHAIESTMPRAGRLTPDWLREQGFG